jgi:hypothetical protein
MVVDGNIWHSLVGQHSRDEDWIWSGITHKSFDNLIVIVPPQPTKEGMCRTALSGSQAPQ